MNERFDNIVKLKSFVRARLFYIEGFNEEGYFATWHRLRNGEILPDAFCFEFEDRKFDWGLFGKKTVKDMISFGMSSEKIKEECKEEMRGLAFYYDQYYYSPQEFF